MKTEKIIKNNTEIINIFYDEVLIKDAQSAVDLMMTVKYDTGVKNLALPKQLFTERFFVLSSGIAGEILQKFVNYKFRIAIYGDFSAYTSKPLKDFIYESNKGDKIFFTDTLDKAVEKLSE